MREAEASGAKIMRLEVELAEARKALQNTVELEKEVAHYRRAPHTCVFPVISAGFVQMCVPEASDGGPRVMRPQGQDTCVALPGVCRGLMHELWAPAGSWLRMRSRTRARAASGVISAATDEAHACSSSFLIQHCVGLRVLLLPLWS